MKQMLAVVLTVCSTPAFALSAVLPQIPPRKSIPLSLAIEASQAALSACATRNSAVTVEVVDLNGLTKVVLSADGAQTNSFEYARRKAYTVLHEGVSSGDYGRSLGKLSANPSPSEGDPNLTRYAGGLPIMRGATMIGVISVSGPTGDNDDEACAQAGLDHIRKRL